jgi:hypothetical protein
MAIQMRLISLVLGIMAHQQCSSKKYSSLLCRAKSAPNGWARFVDRGRRFSRELKPGPHAQPKKDQHGV